MGFALPDDYSEFLRNYGGSAVNAGFPLKANPDHYGGSTIDVFCAAATVLWFYTQGNQQDLKQNSPCLMEFYRGLGLVRPIEEDEVEFEWPSELIIIGSDASGSRICLAIAGLRRGAVFFWYDGRNQGGQGVYLIADSFDEFIRSLKRD